MFVNCVGRHKKALSGKACDRPHSQIVGGTIIQHTERRTIFSADRRGIAVRGDPQRSLFDGGRKPVEQAERNAAFVVEFELPTEKDSDPKPER